jgi:cobalt-zinc-cadmium resistance protein CzcA
MLTAAGLLLGSLLLVPFLGGEFIPILEEGALTPQVLRLPDISLDNSIRVEMETQRALSEFPEVLSNVAKLGRSEIAVDPMELNESDQIVTLKPRDQWTSAHDKEALVEMMRRRLAQIPGINVLMSQPIQERVDELISGTKSEIAIKLFGDDLETLTEKAGEIASIMSTVEGVRDIKVEQQAGQSYLTWTLIAGRLLVSALTCRTSNRSSKRRSGENRPPAYWKASAGFRWRSAFRSRPETVLKPSGMC